ncbi:MAG: serine hydrolase domain-containing protein [Burkholderiaceae bacterium]
MSDAVDLMLDYHQKSGHYPGALVHVEQAGDVICRKVTGRLAGAADAPAMHDQARFRIASLTKPMVSLVVLMLVEEGRISLDTPVSAHLPELRGMAINQQAQAGAEPTIAQLLTHTSGWAYAPEIQEPGLRDRALSSGLAGMAEQSREDFLAALAALPLVVAPGQRFLYGYSTDLLGLILERLDDQPLDELMARRLFAPLGMAASGFRAGADEPAQMPRAVESDLAWSRFNQSFERAEAAARSGAAEPLISGGGGLISTLDDVSRFARLLAARAVFDGRAFISEPLFAQMVSNQLPGIVEGPASFIGSGWGFGFGGAVRLDSGSAAVPAAPGEFTWSGVTGQSLFVDPARGWFALMLSANTASRVMVRFEFRRAVSLL